MNRSVTAAVCVALLLLGCSSATPSRVAPGTESERCLSALGMHDVRPFSLEVRPGGFRPYGVCVGRVAAGSAAAASGLRDGDVITAVDGQPIWSGALVRDQAVGRLARLAGSDDAHELVVARFRYERKTLARGSWPSPIEETLTVSFAPRRSDS